MIVFAFYARVTSAPCATFLPIYNHAPLSQNRLSHEHGSKHRWANLKGLTVYVAPRFGRKWWNSWNFTINDSPECLPCLSHAGARAAFAPCMVTCDRLSGRGQISMEPMRSWARLVCLWAKCGSFQWWKAGLQDHGEYSFIHEIDSVIFIVSGLNVV